MRSPRGRDIRVDNESRTAYPLESWKFPRNSMRSQPNDWLPRKGLPSNQGNGDAAPVTLRHPDGRGRRTARMTGTGWGREGPPGRTHEAVPKRPAGGVGRSAAASKEALHEGRIPPAEGCPSQERRRGVPPRGRAEGTRLTIGWVIDRRHPDGAGTGNPRRAGAESWRASQKPGPPCPPVEAARDRGEFQPGSCALAGARIELGPPSNRWGSGSPLRESPRPRSDLARGPGG